MAAQEQGTVITRAAFDQLAKRVWDQLQITVDRLENTNTGAYESRRHLAETIEALTNTVVTLRR